MSLILDALNRADHERSEESGALNLHINPSRSAPAQSFHWPAFIIVVAVVILILSIFLYFRIDTQPSASETNTNQKTIEAPKPSTRAVSQPTSQPIATPVRPNIESPLTAKIRQDKLHTEASRPNVVGPKQIKEILAPSISQNILIKRNLAKSNTAINSLYQQRNSATTSNIKTNIKLDIEAEENAYDPNSILKSIPLLSEFSFRFQRSVPSIEYNLHVYSDTNVGFVSLNGKRHRVGSQVIAGLRVIAILENSLVLEYQNRQFRLIALNSWINFN